MSDGAATAAAESEATVREAVSPVQMLRRIARGELGEVRVLVGIAVIWTIFQIANDRFLSAVNLSNLTLQIAAVATISIGVVLVLLLGEIDLSVGAVSGLAAADDGGAGGQGGPGARAGAAGRAADRHRDRAVQRLHGHHVRDPLVRGHARGIAGLAGGAVGGAGRLRLGQPAPEHHHRPDQHLLRPGGRLGDRDRRHRRLRSEPVHRPPQAARGRPGGSTHRRSWR